MFSQVNKPISFTPQHIPLLKTQHKLSIALGGREQMGVP